jgi:hypothetical protein
VTILQIVANGWAVDRNLLPGFLVALGTAGIGGLVWRLRRGHGVTRLEVPEPDTQTESLPATVEEVPQVNETEPKPRRRRRRIESDGSSPEDPARPVKPRRARSSTRGVSGPASAAVPNRAVTVTWVQIAPGKYVRVESELAAETSATLVEGDSSPGSDTAGERVSDSSEAWPEGEPDGTTDAAAVTTEIGLPANPGA